MSMKPFNAADYVDFVSRCAKERAELVDAMHATCGPKTTATEYDLSIEALSGGTAYLPDEDPQSAYLSDLTTPAVRSDLERTGAARIADASVRHLSETDYDELELAIRRRAKADANASPFISELIEITASQAVDAVLIAETGMDSDAATNRLYKDLFWCYLAQFAETKREGVA